MSRPIVLSFLVVSLLSLVPLRAQAEDSGASSDAERLGKLEQAVRQLQQRNIELEEEVHQLKKREPFAPVLPST